MTKSCLSRSTQLEPKPRPRKTSRSPPHQTLCLHSPPFPTFNMHTLSQLVFLGVSLFSVSQAARFGTPEILSEMTYARAHSLGTNYTFHEGHGWEPVLVSSPRSRRSLPSSDTTNTSLSLSGAGLSSLTSKRSKKPSLADTLVHTINSAWNGLRGSGRTEEVKITWYTGQDLENPSCWAEPIWAPTVGR